MSRTATVIPIERIENAILLILGEKVIMDTELAALYGVETRSLILAVKRNRERFRPISCSNLREKSLML